jgi:hypothetical protein
LKQIRCWSRFAGILYGGEVGFAANGLFWPFSHGSTPMGFSAFHWLFFSAFHSPTTLIAGVFSHHSTGKKFCIRATRIGSSDGKREWNDEKN